MYKGQKMVSETDFIQDLLQSKHVYAYYVPSLDVIKVGFGDDAKNRMLNYCKNYGITPDISSLRSWEMPASALASAMETALHRGLHKAGFSRYMLQTKNGVAQELFALNGTPYVDAFLYITDIFDIVCKELVSKLHYNHTDTEKVRQRQKVFADKQRKQNHEAYLRNNTIMEEKQILLDKEWAIGWDKYIKPWVNFVVTADKIRSSYKPPLAVRFFGGDEFSHFIKWSGFILLLELLPKTFIAERQAREFTAKFVKKYGYTNPTDWNVSYPCIKAVNGHPRRPYHISDHRLIHYFNFYNGRTYEYTPTNIEDEIRNVIQEVTGFGSENADKLLVMNKKEIIKIRELAHASPMPEIDIFKF